MDGEGIKLIRKRLQKTQAEMAGELGVSRQSYIAWEKDTYRIPQEKLEKLLALDSSIPADGIKPKNAALVRDTIKYYGEMRRDGIAHADIVELWHRKAFAPSPEAQAGILAEWPDILA